MIRAYELQASSVPPYSLRQMEKSIASAATSKQVFFCVSVSVSLKNGDTIFCGRGSVLWLFTSFLSLIEWRLSKSCPAITINKHLDTFLYYGFTNQNFYTYHSSLNFLLFKFQVGLKKSSMFEEIVAEIAHKHTPTNNAKKSEEHNNGFALHVL